MDGVDITTTNNSRRSNRLCSNAEILADIARVGVVELMLVMKKSERKTLALFLVSDSH